MGGDVPMTFRAKIRNEQLQMELKQFINEREEEDSFELLLHWKEFMENILSREVSIARADETSLLMYLEFRVSDHTLLDGFPKDLMLVHCCNAFEVAAKQFKERWSKLVYRK